MSTCWICWYRSGVGTCWLLRQEGTRFLDLDFLAVLALLLVGTGFLAEETTGLLVVTRFFANEVVGFLVRVGTFFEALEDLVLVAGFLDGGGAWKPAAMKHNRSATTPSLRKIRSPKVVLTAWQPTTSRSP